LDVLPPQPLRCPKGSSALGVGKRRAGWEVRGHSTVFIFYENSSEIGKHPEPQKAIHPEQAAGPSNKSASQTKQGPLPVKLPTTLTLKLSRMIPFVTAMCVTWTTSMAN
jgi:hypothetical protein